MKILGIDTSTMISSVSLMIDGLIVGDYSINQEKTHSESLIPMIDEMLRQLDVEIQEIDRIAVAKGPGSFTGLRIGMTTAKTIAQILHIDIVGVSTLHALANHVISSKKVIPIMDARGGRVYYSIYEQGKEIGKEDLIYLEDLIKTLQKDAYLFVGDGILPNIELIEKSGIEYMKEPINHCMGRSICEIANKTKVVDNIFTLAPEYIRKSQAQRDLEKKLNDQKMSR